MLRTTLTVVCCCCNPRYTVKYVRVCNRDCEPVGKPCYMLGTYTTPKNDSAAADPNLNPKQGWGIAEWFSRSVAHCWEPIFQVSQNRAHSKLQ